MRVANASNAGEHERRRFPDHSSVFQVPLSISSGRELDQKIGGRRRLFVTLDKRRKECHREYQGDADNTACDPIKGWSEELTAIHPIAQRVATSIEFTNGGRVQCPDEDHWDHRRSVTDRSKHNRHLLVTTRTWIDKMIKALLI